MSWFDQNELPLINSIDDLKKAMEVVKSRFNGYPHKYTRNDYLLLINTLYAALKYSGDTKDFQQEILVWLENYRTAINNELSGLKEYIDNKEYPAKLQWEQLK